MNVWHAYEFWHWFDGYWEALTSEVFWEAMWHTVLFTVVCTTVEFGLGFALALLLLKNFRGRGVLMVFFLLPMMVVPAVTGFIFFMIFQVDGPAEPGARDHPRPPGHDRLAVRTPRWRSGRRWWPTSGSGRRSCS